MRKIIPYHPALMQFAKKLRKYMTLGEVALCREIKSKKLGARHNGLDVKNNLNWVWEEIRTVIEALEPTPNPSQEGKSHSL